MNRAPLPIPTAVLGAISANRLNLESYVGKRLNDFCDKYGSLGDDKNHCAHFVSHLLQLRIPGAALCSNVADSQYSYEDRFNGYCIRVNQVFNSCKNRLFWDDNSLPHKVCFVVATLRENIESTDPVVIGQMSKKHIGFYSDGWVYHYGNTRDRVKKVSIAAFKSHYGVDTVLLKADLP